MTDETTTVTAEAAPEPAPDTAAATETAEPKAEPEKQPEPDYRAAYVGLQRSQNRLHKRVEDVLGQNSALADTVRILKEGQTAILKQTVGEEEVARMEASEKSTRERSAALQAAVATQAFVETQTGLFIETLSEAGVDLSSIDWAKDASNVQEWKERVGPSVKAALQKANAERIRKTEEGLRAKTSKEVKEEAEALTQRQMKEAGVDRIDTGKGSSTASLTERLLKMDRNSPEFEKMLNDAKAGRLATK